MFLPKCFANVSQMKVKFYSRKGKNDERVIVCLIFSREQMLKVSTKHSIPIGTWNKSEQQVDSSVIGADELNEALLKLKLDILKQYRLLCLDEVTEWEVIKSKLQSFVITGSTENKKQEEDTKDLGMVDAVSQFMEARSVEYKRETIRKYEVLQAVWLQFESHRKKSVSVLTLSFTVMEEFRQYLINVRKNRNDTVYKMLASLKSFIRWLIQNGYSVDKKCLELRQKVKSKYEIVTLTESEITKLSEVKLKKEQRVIRDCFLFQLYTGQRFSDMQQLNPEQICNEAWRFQSVKTSKDMYVPMVGWGAKAYEIARKYDFIFPRYASQYYNRALKKICESAKINESVTLKRFNGSKAITIKKPKYDLVSSHTARRTCVSQLLAKGVPPTVVMKLTGHSSIQTMMRYERTTNDSLISALAGL